MRMSAGPVGPAGVSTWRLAGLVNVTLAAGTPPNHTRLDGSNPCPVTSTTVPPGDGPYDGKSESMRGGPTYVNALVAAGGNDEAEATLAKALRQDWNEALVALYGRVRVERTERQIGAAEAWLKARPNDPALLLALGRIMLANRDWAKAREYLEASLKHRRDAETYAELGRLCLAMGERPRAAELLSQAVTLGGQLPELPLPDANANDANAVRS